MLLWFDRPKLIALGIFCAGVVATGILFQNSITRQFVIGIGNDGYFGVLVAGVLYAISFTASFATVLLLNLSNHTHPILAAFIGGFGALLYDLLVFSFARKESHLRLVASIKARIPGRTRVPRWVIIGTGMVVLASPLPDELAAGLLGFSSISPRSFFLLSFLMNTIGIFILLLFR
ncbi:MAG: hypothetical protein V1778_02215 [bacterium]